MWRNKSGYKKEKKSMQNTTAFHRQCRQTSGGKLPSYDPNPSQIGEKMCHLSRAVKTHEQPEFYQYPLLLRSLLTKLSDVSKAL